MRDKRRNIALPADVVKRLSKVPNKSAFIADAIDLKLRTAAKERRRAERLAAYKYIQAHPEYEKDARPDW
jgi:hypothetical protein